jgi:hypothetical protein
VVFIFLIGVALILPTVLIYKTIKQGRRIKRLEQKFERYVKEATEKTKGRQAKA